MKTGFRVTALIIVVVWLIMVWTLVYELIKMIF